jgi:hypothetical protein
MSYLLLPLLTILAALLYLLGYFRWQKKQREGDRYFSRPYAERLALQETMRWHGKLLLPLIELLLRLKLMKTPQSVSGFTYQGVTGPQGSCSEVSFRAAHMHAASEEDLFVVSQMKSGTTWLQQIAYELLMDGQGDLGDEGHRHMYALSPWIEAHDSVSMENAPLIGQPRRRLIKTHLPASLCPYSEASNYLYIARHPVNCFASCVDFFAHLMGPTAHSLDAMADWFCSDNMYWTAWPDHVANWWDLAQQQDNILFLHFEALRADPALEVSRVAQFLGKQVSGEQLALVRERTGFDYMQAHEHQFEMSPPNLFSVAGDGAFLQQGGARQKEAIPSEISQRIVEFCRHRLRGRDYPAASFYPDLAAGE